MRLEPWSAADRALLEKLVGDPAMMEHLGGPEGPEMIADRQLRYVAADSGVYKVVDEGTGDAVGWVGFWDKQWREVEIYEIGWAVLPAFQGRGIAGAATEAAIALARAEGRHRYVHAFPSVGNGPSNAICARLGFTLLGECDFEYPKGNLMRCNDWRLDLL